MHFKRILLAIVLVQVCARTMIVECRKAGEESVEERSKAKGVCKDRVTAKQCEDNKKAGKCDNDIGMKTKCAKTCGYCKKGCNDISRWCHKWQKRGGCKAEESKISIKGLCRRTCNVCNMTLSGMKKPSMGRKETEGGQKELKLKRPSTEKKKQSTGKTKDKQVAELRIIGGPDNATGFLQVKRDGKWMNVSYSGFSYRIKDDVRGHRGVNKDVVVVLCKQAGIRYEDPRAMRTPFRRKMLSKRHMEECATLAPGKNVSQPIKQDSFKTTEKNCFWNKFYIGCRGDPFLKQWIQHLLVAELRITGGPDNSTGLLQVKKGAKWMDVIHGSFNLDALAALCKQAGIRHEKPRMIRMPLIPNRKSKDYRKKYVCAQLPQMEPTSITCKEDCFKVKEKTCSVWNKVYIGCRGDPFLRQWKKNLAMAELRITGGPDNSTGFLQVQKAGKWMNVSNRGFSHNFVADICRQAGIRNKKPVMLQPPFYHTGHYNKKKTDLCGEFPPQRSSAKPCKQDCFKVTEKRCSQWEKVYIGCQGDPFLRQWKQFLPNVQFRLTGDKDSSEGILEMKYPEKWRRVCLRTNRPDLVCRRLGFVGGRMENKRGREKGSFLGLGGFCGKSKWLDECLTQRAPYEMPICYQKTRFICTTAKVKHSSKEKENSVSSTNSSPKITNGGIKVTCDSRYFRVSINKRMLHSIHQVPLNVHSIKLEDTNCRAKETTNGILLLSPITGCGMKQRVDGNSIIYSNTLSYQSKTPGNVFKKRLRCSIPQQVSTSGQLLSMPELKVIAGQGNALVSFNVYEDGKFQKKMISLPNRVSSKKPLFVEMRLNTTDPSLRLSPLDCYISSKPAFKLSLIKNRCPAIKTVWFLNWKDTLIQFKLHWTSKVQPLSPVYLTCTVTICGSQDDRNKCKMQACGRRGRLSIH